MIDDFRAAEAYRNGRAQTTKLRKQDKGQADEVRYLCAVVLEGKSASVSLDDLAATTRATFRICESLRTGQALMVSRGEPLFQT